MKKISALIALAAVVAAIFLLLRRDDQQPAPPPAQPVVAVVNGEPIPLEEFLYKYQRFVNRLHIPASLSGQALFELKLSFLNKLIETRLLLQQARMRNLSVSEEELDREIEQLKEDYPKDTLNETLEQIGIQLNEWREDRREKLLIDKLIRQEVDEVIHVSDDEVAGYYRQHLQEFQQPQMVKVSQIVVSSEEEANALRSRLLRGEDFAELARQYSLSPDAERGGDLGTFAKGQMPEEFDQVVFRYKVGSISRVVTSPYGYHLFRVEDRIPPRTPALEEVHEAIRQNIFQQRQETFFNQWLESLGEQARITTYPQLLQEEEERDLAPE